MYVGYKEFQAWLCIFKSRLGSSPFPVFLSLDSRSHGIFYASERAEAEEEEEEEEEEEDESMLKCHFALLLRYLLIAHGK